MAETYIDAQQAKPAPTILTTLYTVPVATSTIVSSLWVCNQSGQLEYVRVSVAPGGAADAVQQYLVFDRVIFPNDTISAVAGITLATGTVVRVQSRNGNAAFSLFGVQIT